MPPESTSIARWTPNARLSVSSSGANFFTRWSRLTRSTSAQQGAIVTVCPSTRCCIDAPEGLGASSLDTTLPASGLQLAISVIANRCRVDLSVEGASRLLLAMDKGVQAWVGSGISSALAPDVAGSERVYRLFPCSTMHQPNRTCTASPHLCQISCTLCLQLGDASTPWSPHDDLLVLSAMMYTLQYYRRMYPSCFDPHYNGRLDGALRYSGAITRSLLDITCVSNDTAVLLAKSELAKSDSTAVELSDAITATLCSLLRKQCARHVKRPSAAAAWQQLLVQDAPMEDEEWCWHDSDANTEEEEDGLFNDDVCDDGQGEDFLPVDWDIDTESCTSFDEMTPPVSSDEELEFSDDEEDGVAKLLQRAQETHQRRIALFGSRPPLAEGAE